MLDIVVFLATFLTMASQFAVAKLGFAAGLTAWDIVAIRYVAAAVSMAPFLFSGRLRARLADKPLPFLTIAILGGAPYGILLALAVESAPSIHGVVIVPALTVIISFSLSRVLLGIPLDRERIAGAIVTVVGLVLFGLGAGATLTDRILVGDAYFLAAGCFWALFTVMQRHWALEPLATIAAIAIGGAVTVPLFLPFAASGLGEAGRGVVLGQALYHGPLHTCLSFYLYGLIIRRSGATTAALGIACVPLFGVAIGVGLLGEHPQPLQWAGIATVALGLGVASGGWSRLRPSPSPGIGKS